MGCTPEHFNPCWLSHAHVMVSTLPMHTPKLQFWWAAGMSQLAEALTGLPHLAELDVASCGLTSASTVAQLTSLQRLNLQGNDVTDASIEELVVGFTSRGSLCSLNLSSNKQVHVSWPDLECYPATCHQHTLPFNDCRLAPQVSLLWAICQA